MDLPVKFQLDSTSHAVNPIDHSVRWRSTIDDSTCTKFVKQSHSRDNHLISTSPSGNFSSLFPVLFTFSPFQRNSVHALLTWNQDRSRRSIFPSILASLTDEGGREYCSLFPSSTRKKNPTRARLAQDNPTCCQESSHSIRAKISESSNRSFEPHPTITVRRTLRYRYRQTLYLIRTHDSGKGTRRRGEAVIRSVLQRNTTITRWPVSLSLSLFSRERRTEPRRFQEAKKSRALNFPSSLAKKKFERAVRGLSRGPKGARWTYSAKRVIKPETTREKVGFRIRAGWWSSSLCLRAQAELRPSYSVSFPPHLLLSSTVIPRPSSDPASRSLGEFLSLSVARLARWRQPRAMASNLSRNFRI